MRVCIFSTTTWKDVHDLLNVMISVCWKLNICGVRMLKFDSSSVPAEETENVTLVAQSEQVDASLTDYVLSLRAAEQECQGSSFVIGNEEVIEAGIKAFRNYGVGPGSARWFYGSFDIFIALEQRLAGLYPSMLHHAKRCRGKCCIS